MAITDGPDPVSETFPWGESKTELWFAWTHIATEHERQTATARRAARRAYGVGGSSLAKALERETVASMVTVVAAAAALETMGRHLAEFLAEPVTAKSAAERVLRTAAAVFPTFALDDPLRANVKRLFDLRNDTAHYTSRWEEMTTHPIGARTIQVAATYTFEAAEHSVDTLLETLRRATAPGDGSNADAEFWALRWRSLPDELAAGRPGKSSRRL